MKKQKILSRFLAMVLTICLLITLAPARTLADEDNVPVMTDYKNWAYTKDHEYTYERTLDGFSAMDPPKSGMGVISINSPHTEATVTGVIEAANTGATVYAEGTTKFGSATVAEVTTSGINAKNGNGLEVEAVKGGMANGEDKSSVFAGGIGVVVDANGTDAAGTTPSSAAAFVNGVTASGTEGIRVTAENGGQAGLIGGEITDTATQAFGAWTQASATSTAVASEKPDPGTLSYDPETGAFLLPGVSDWTWSTPSGNVPAAVSIVDGVTASAGVHVESDGATAQMKVGEKGIAVTEGNPHDRTDSFLANSVKSSNRGSSTLDVDGEINSKANGVSVRTETGGWAVVNTEVVFAGEEGVDLDNEGGVILVQTDAISSDLNGVDANTGSSDATNFVIVDGDVTSANENAIHIDNYGGQAMVAVAGNAKSNAEPGDPSAPTAGLFYSGSGSDSQAVVLVVDTLSGTNGVYLDSGSDPSKLDLTVWAIDSPDEEHLIVGQDAETFAKTVSYIVNVEYGADGELYAIQADGSALEKKFDNEGKGGFEVANEDQKVILKTDDQHVIKAAFNGRDTEIKLEKDKNGNYYYIVPRGGGVWLHAVLELIRQGGGSVTVSTAPSGIITLDLGGGTMNGPTEIRKAVGKTFVFTEEPVWEGHTFLYWQSTSDPDVRYHTGDKFVIQGNASFVAVWE